MSRDIGDELIESMNDAISYMSGKEKGAVTHKVRIPEKIDVQKIRKTLKLSRTQFAACFGFSARTLQHWEQGDRKPQGAARVLLVLLQRDPKTIAQILLDEDEPLHVS